MAKATPRRTSKPRAAKALTTYRRKRDFARTAEPSGAEAVAAGGNSFVVQKHAASHLHYDFRLEMDGVLKSWAVAKGPSVDPAVKRLAIEVEDHPLAYGDFEGTIPKGEYGGGTVMVWDRGTWEPTEDPHKGFRTGRLKFKLNGTRMKGLWALVRMKPRPKDRHPNWLLIKDRDPAAAPGNADKLLRQSSSAKTKRSMEEIAAGEEVWHSNRAAANGKGKPKAAAKKKSAPAKAAASKSAIKVALKSKHAPPVFVAPQLATRVDAAPAGDDWLHEIKFDGYRLHCRLDHGKVRILTRRGQDWTDKFPDLAAEIAALPAANAYIDGEAVVLDKAGISDFSALQNWFKNPNGAFVTFYAFDLLFLNGENLRDAPLIARKEKLRALLDAGDAAHIRYSDHQAGHGPAFFKASQALHVEGIVSKSADAAYESGRSATWLKVKRIERQEFVIGGFTLSTHSKTAIGALLLGEYRGKELIFVGKVGTGFSNSTARDLFKQLSALRADEPPFDVPSAVRRTAIWIKPKVVAEIEFGAWTSDHILRHAAFVALREDKNAKDVQTEPVASVADVAETPSPKRRAGKATASRTADSGDNVVGGITISHPDRLIYRAEHISKLQVARYYEQVADHMLPHIAGRPLALVRCPDGVGPACFFQKHAGKTLPKSVRETRISPKKEDTVLTVDTAEGLIALIQNGVLEIHTWGSHLKTVEHPDLMVFDLDPDPKLKWPVVVKAAVDLRQMLKGLGLTSFVKTTGGKGLHVVVPVTPRLAWDEVKAFTRAVATQFAAKAPDLFVVNMSMKVRGGHIFVDYLRNGRGATAVAPYSTRARTGAAVATPLGWDELEGGAEPGDFTVTTVPRRIAGRFTDPWKKMAGVKQRLTAKMIKMLGE
jgi:bifunctional non-homologous end joining protein LigD